MSLTNIVSKLKQRLEQQERQDQIDRQLKTLPCAELVRDLLLQERQLNREQTKIWKDVPIWNISRIIDLLDHQLDVVEQRQQSVAENLSKDSPCEGLGQFLKFNLKTISE